MAGEKDKRDGGKWGRLLGTLLRQNAWENQSALGDAVTGRGCAACARCDVLSDIVLRAYSRC